MDERHDPQSSAPAEGELLAAYLDAQTDEVTSARIERLLRQDPQAAARLDAIARTRARLQRLDGAVPPDGFRERLDARLQSERAEARHPHVAREPRRSANRLAPLAAVAALVLVAVLGVGALLGQTASSQDEAAGGAAEMQADAPAATSGNAPLAGADGENAERDSGEEALEGDARTSAEAALPQGGGDAEITRRLEAQDTGDPSTREAELRASAGLPAEPVCVDAVDAEAVDLVERNGEVVLVALIPGRSEPRVVVFDPADCARVRTFAP
jgi:negative regulator of sigma E activity